MVREGLGVLERGRGARELRQAVADGETPGMRGLGLKIFKELGDFETPRRNGSRLKTRDDYRPRMDPSDLPSSGGV